RAGTDVAVRHEIAALLRGQMNVAVVERENLDLILQEQQLSALADPETAAAPGKIKIARYLSFVDFDQIDSDPFVFLRVTDTQTGEIVLHYKANMPPGKVLGPVGAIVDELAHFYRDQEVRGMIADAADENAILTNLTALHGVKADQVFTVLQEGEPIEAGGRVIAYRQRPVARVQVTGFDEQTGLAVCKLLEKRDGVRIDKDMKIKSSE
ncbi:MAG TPA: CsgG/HfaB family protein, partial [Candidatus Hydrogenedentes bacterium]|nr:CsgG/HfaB family protein [Candidatus Hydrogenedentota bacterium]